ncbi:hypothetical protein [Gordonibacter sp. An230]|uniref:hypothetical protein n=1 Tax=Gordonibacter sp. An230 TaxID=1965592 RepID=UPI001EF48D98|nr:hypothetical protein [Gordonibacter sp. An230]
MSDVEAFVIDDDFDPLADLDLDEGERDDAEADYLPPIPDADKSVVPPPVELSPAERIEKLLSGMPGQQFRLLRAVELCTESRTLEEAASALDEAHPSPTSVYNSIQVIQLLERAGALERLEHAEAEDGPAQGEGFRAKGAVGGSADAAVAAPVAEADAASPEGEGLDGSFISVTPAPPCRYQATQAGLDAIAAHVNEDRIVHKITEEKHYLPIFQRVLEMTAREGGCPTKELDAAVDGDPLCAEPRRFCGFFRGKLEETGAIEWRDTWAITDLGRSVLASGLFEASSSAEGTAPCSSGASASSDAASFAEGVAALSSSER